MRCHGKFSTCEICNNAAYILRTQTKWTKSQRDIILQLRRVHLRQQAEEHINLEYRKNFCKDLDENSQPIAFLLFYDGITASLGDTPNYGIEGHKCAHTKNATSIANRTIGVEIIL